MEGELAGGNVLVCEVDLRAGGTWRSVVRGADGTNMGMRGVYREIAPPERLVHTESFDAWYPGESLVTTRLVERAAQTTFTGTVLYRSREVRDAVINSGMEQEAAKSYDKLADMLASADARDSSQPSSARLTP